MNEQRTILFAALLTFTLIVIGCNGTPDIPRAEVTPTDLAPTVITDTTPRERDLLEHLDLTGATVTEILEAQMKLDRDRTSLAMLVADQQAQIRAAEADKQTEIRGLAADKQAAILAAETAQKAEIALKVQRAKTARNIAVTLGGIGILALVAAPFIFLFVDRKLAIAAMAISALSIAASLSVNFIDAALEQAIGPVAKTLSWIIPGLLIVLLCGIAFAVVMKLWVWWQTNRQAANLRADANLRRVVDPSEEAETDAQKMEAQAAVLDHVGTKNYDPKVTFTPSER